MKLFPTDWQKIPMPLGLSAALGCFVWGLWMGLHIEFVAAQEFGQFKRNLEIRSVERDIKPLETEILKLEGKQSVYPKKFDAIDKAILKKHKKDLAALNKDLEEAKTRSLK